MCLSCCGLQAAWIGLFVRDVLAAKAAPPAHVPVKGAQSISTRASCRRADGRPDGRSDCAAAGRSQLAYAPLFGPLTVDDIRASILPTVERMLLRSPEVALAGTTQSGIHGAG